MFKTVADNSNRDKGHEPRCFEARVCGEGFCAVYGLRGASLELDAVPAEWDGEEEVDECEDVKDEREVEFLCFAGGLLREGVGVAGCDLAVLEGCPGSLALASNLKHYIENSGGNTNSAHPPKPPPS